ncbi:MAG: hypothetical protein K8T90_03235 [Planctomycetes bacterium]|nr:hypothetical protein [Planctomycetota bacterium]
MTGPVAPRTPPAHAWIAATVIAFVAAAVHAVTNRGEILHGLSDESLLVPLARKAWNPQLYAGDAWLSLAEQVFSRTYSFLFGAVLEVADDPVVAMRVLALPFHIVFLAGSYRLVEAVRGRGAALSATIALAMLPSILSLAGHVAAGPLAAGAALPRDLVFALIPWLFIARDAASEAMHGRLARRAALFFALGLLANLHPLTAIHVAALFVLLDVMRPHPGGLRAVGVAVAVAGAAFAVGALPFVAQWLAYPRTPGVVPRELVLWRVGGIGADTPSIWMARIELQLFVVASACVLGRGRPDPARRALRTAALVALVLAALGPVFNMVVAGIQFDRLTRVALWIAALLWAAELPGALRARDRVALALAIALVLTGVHGRTLMRTVAAANRGSIEWVARRIELRVGIAEPVKPDLLPDRPRPGEPSIDAARAAAFLDVCAWFRRLTGPVVPPAWWMPPLVAVPPEDFGAFRAYSGCGAVVTKKEGGFALSFLGGRGNDWFAEYGAAVGAWSATNPIARDVLGKSRGVRWAVLDADQEAPASWTEVHRAPPYRVFRTSAE